MEHPVQFLSEAGHRLMGILHVPHGPGRPAGYGLVLLNIGLHYRVCHNRLFVKLARALSREGYHVLRFDTHGVGDSEGEIEAGSVLVHFDRVQRGLFVPDTRAALDHLSRELGLERFVLAGLCGGALTAIHTAAEDRRVQGVIFIAGPMTVTSPTEDREFHPWEAGQWLAGYRARLRNPRAWARLVSGKSDYGMMVRALVVKMHHRWCQMWTGSALGRPGAAPGGHFNTHYLDSFQRFVGRGGKVLFVFPELDKTAEEFEIYFDKPILTQTRAFEGKYEILRIERANHSFTLAESQERLRDGVLTWLRTA